MLSINIWRRMRIGANHMTDTTLQISRYNVHRIKQ
jgi:hypothetical protein